jgi:uncharacterized membrane protein
MSEPISLLVPAALVGLVAVPLALKLVPPNRIYGFRTAKTLDSRELWFRINRFAGLGLIAAAAATICVFLAMPELASGRSFTGMLVLIVPVIAALVATVAYARKIERRSN